MNTIYNLNQNSSILLSLAIILLSGFLFTRITKLAKLPNVTGFILAGVAIGPYALNLVAKPLLDDMNFVTDIALALIAFGVGRFFKKEVFYGTGSSVLIIALFEALLAGVLVSLVMFFIFRFDIHFSLLLGAIATATAPASTMITIRQYRAKGHFVNVLLQAVAFDNAICLLLFSMATAVIVSDLQGGSSFYRVTLPIVYNGLALFIGFLSGLILSKVITPARSEDNRLIVTVTLLLIISGICSAMDVSPLMACMLFGTVYINKTKDNELFDHMDKFSPPILSMFFVMSGMSLDIAAVVQIGHVGLIYFLIRILGKFAGAYLGCLVVGTSSDIKNYLGLALIPQAGVSIGLAFLGRRMLPGEIGETLLTIILASSVLYELAGPISAKLSLIYSGSINTSELQNKI